MHVKMKSKRTISLAGQLGPWVRIPETTFLISGGIFCFLFTIASFFLDEIKVFRIRLFSSFKFPVSMGC